MAPIVRDGRPAAAAILAAEVSWTAHEKVAAAAAAVEANHQKLGVERECGHRVLPESARDLRLGGDTPGRVGVWQGRHLAEAETRQWHAASSATCAGGLAFSGTGPGVAGTPQPHCSGEAAIAEMAMGDAAAAVVGRSRQGLGMNGPVHVWPPESLPHHPLCQLCWCPTFYDS